MRAEWQRKWDHPPAGSLSRWTQTAGLNYELGTLSRSPICMAVAHVFGPSATAFLGSLAGSWIGSRAARTWTLGHNIGPIWQFLKYIRIIKHSILLLAIYLNEIKTYVHIQICNCLIIIVYNSLDYNSLLETTQMSLTKEEKQIVVHPYNVQSVSIFKK